MKASLKWPNRVPTPELELRRERRPFRGFIRKPRKRELPNRGPRGSELKQHKTTCPPWITYVIACSPPKRSFSGIFQPGPPFSDCGPPHAITCITHAPSSRRRSEGPCAKPRGRALMIKPHSVPPHAKGSHACPLATRPPPRPTKVAASKVSRPATPPRAEKCRGCPWAMSKAKCVPDSPPCFARGTSGGVNGSPDDVPCPWAASRCTGNCCPPMRERDSLFLMCAGRQNRIRLLQAWGP